jgi:hypothetical protein
MKRCAAGLALSFLLCIGICHAASVEMIGPNELLIEIESNLSQFSFEQIGGYDYVRSPGAALIPEEAVPCLPRIPYSVAIPVDRRVLGIETICRSEIEVDGTFRIAPTQPPAVLSGSAVAWVDGREEIYSSDQWYPRKIVGGVRDGFMGNSRVLSFHVSPFRWNPSSGRLLLCERIEVRVELEPASPGRPFRRRAIDRDPFFKTVEGLVVNPGNVRAFAAHTGSHHLLGASMLEEADYEYVIITVDSLVSCFDPLIEWKNQKGVRAKCVTLEWIEANYSGDTTQDVIRNFIIDAYQTWGTVWVLLGADTGLLPSRRVFAMDAEMGLDGNKIRADLYFADLDGNWNANGVSPYGEVADSVDMYPDLIVGRAPAENVAEATVFVDKVLTYEKNPPSDYALKMLMPGEILWLDPYTDSGIGLDRIDEDFIPPRFDPILKLYESQGNETVESVLAAMSDGQNFVIHDGHCNEYVMGAGDGYIFREDADTLSNSPRNFILNSIGCWPAAIDKNCIGERFMNNPDGGCVAFIGNCRYGWGSPGNPGFGYSDVFQYEWARSVFANEVFAIGQSLAESKALFVSFAGDSNVYRWNEYQLNLLGDPEMPVWTDDPEDLIVTAPSSVMGTGDLVHVVVEDGAGAVEDALVCLMNDDDLYQAGRTDISGAVSFSISTSSPDSLLLTVTASNRLPYQARIEVVTEGVLLAWTDAAVEDGGDGWVNPGETVDLVISVRNYGSEPDSGVWGILRATDGLCTIVDSTVYYGHLASGWQTLGIGHYSADFDESLQNGQAVVLELALVDSTSNQWVSRVPVVVAAPVLSVSSYGIDDRLGGDGDWIVEPDEGVLVTLEVFNCGLTYAGAEVFVTSLDPYFAVVDSVTDIDEIGGSSTGYSLHNLTVMPACPLIHIGGLEVTINASDGQAFTDTVHFSVGDLSFTDDCESGEGGWACSGLWHISTYRSHSDSSSWYFGSDSTHRYPNSAGGRMLSETFLAGVENVLSFWFWHDFPTYGVDGIYVILLKNGVPDTLDFFGSGGALGGDGALNIITDWVKWERVLDDVAPGDSIAVKLRFESDGTDYAEGIYLDDISLRCKTPVLTAVDETAGGVSPLQFSMFPNPAHDCLSVAFAEARNRVTLDIYSVEGKLVARLVKPAGAHSVSWNIEDAAGRRVAPGIYLARVKGEVHEASRKIVVLR